MSEEYISISMLNDFIFCPYSIYLHNVYMSTDEGFYQATPQTKGQAAHQIEDQKTEQSKGCNLIGLPVYSAELGLMGKIDLYKKNTKQLIERKYNLKQIFKGQLYQLWAQYWCMIEMGYEIHAIAFHEISSNTLIPIKLPTDRDKKELKYFINQFKTYEPGMSVVITPNKCTHCIYCNLCDKIEASHVYE